jgi:hypothetical protein
MYAFDTDPVYLYQSDYVYGPVAINAEVAEMAVSDGISVRPTRLQINYLHRLLKEDFR